MDSTPESLEKLPGGTRNLYEVFSQVHDPRRRRGVRYPLAMLLTVVALAKLCGETELRGIAQWAQYRADQLCQALALKRQQMPHWTTYSRVLSRLDAGHLQAVIQAGLDTLDPGSTRHLILDGKALRGTIPPGHTQGEHLLSLYAPERRQVVAQEAVGRKENEITAAPRVLAQVDLAHKLVSGDAMFTHRDLSEIIVKAGGAYLWTVKENQPQLYQMIAYLFTPHTPLPGHGQPPTDFRSATRVAKGHGRVERRTLTASSLLNSYADWPGVQQVFRLERHRQPWTGPASTEVAYGITSLPAETTSPAALLTLTRRHWAIENQLHYPRDVSLREDACRLHSVLAQRCMAVLNTLVLTLLVRTPFSFLPDAQRFFAAHLSQALDLFL
jgi:predicted transposase YbfD/YdcC